MIRGKILVAASVAAMSMAIVGNANAGMFGGSTAAAPAVTGTTLQEGLASGYADLASREYAEFDYVDGDAFAAKRDLAKAGGNVEPWMASNWNITGDELMALDAARARIMEAYEKGGDFETPIPLAKAQTSYDCWVQEVEEQINVEHANACRAAYEQAIADVRYPEPKKQEPKVVEPISFSIYFDHDSTELSPEAYSDIAQAAAAANSRGAKLVVVHGHTDTSGSVAYNEKLAAARADVVGAALIAEGIDPDLLELAGFGESRLAIATPDGVRERGNRRAEVELRFDD